MIFDLEKSAAVERHVDVLVIGAGTAGLPTAALLARTGELSVLCLESGGRHSADGTQSTNPLNQVVQANAVHAGASMGRFRCMGGTSTRWGAALIPFLDEDFSDPPWPIGSADLARYEHQVERLFGLREGPYDANGIDESGQETFAARSAKLPPFNRRNVFRLFRRECQSARGPEIWLNATVTDFTVTNQRVQRVTAKSAGGVTITVVPRQVIIAAGAIETTRLMLLLDHQNGGIVRAASPSLGCYFSDHLSARFADVVPHDPAALNRALGIRFEGGGMRDVRFNSTIRRANHADNMACYAHLIAEPASTSGFAALRDLLRHRQARSGPPPFALMLRLSRHLPWLLRCLWWFCFERRLLFADSQQLGMHMYTEQAACARNRITLDPAQVDRFGKPLALIQWSVRESDFADFCAATAAFADHWERSTLSRHAHLVPRDRQATRAEFMAGGGNFHPTGSTRMAADASSGVVNGNLDVFALDNLKLLSTSVLPTGGGANPTMTLLVLAMRCVEQITAQNAARRSRQESGSHCVALPPALDCCPDPAS